MREEEAWNAIASDAPREWEIRDGASFLCRVTATNGDAALDDAVTYLVEDAQRYFQQGCKLALDLRATCAITDERVRRRLALVVPEGMPERGLH